MDSQKDFRDLENDLAEFSEASHSIINDSKNLAKELKQKYRERLDNFGVRELINITMRYKNTHMKKGTNWALARVGGNILFYIMLQPIIKDMFTTLYFSIPLGLGTAYLLERSRRKKDENNISSYFISRFREESYRDVFNNSPRRVVDYFARPEIIKFYK